ncbi:TPA: hypothetical protein NKU35_000318 [Vibrio parahaemolyticus]|uniref:Uncharacterized protein n=1 Tax=Vibrio parahaemolyticus TaxID=670 RepID=A0A7M1WNH9_VIBPH|nr:hypothetical protein [Vibrio parahaemolyticus]ELN6867947.1 hypothetical protein [Vibrio parahaemolyticus]MDI7833601.1 hypothetical protein [Vibrio parahaemolyticus]QOS28515.1 hypothetical protein VP387_00015 [Vibrio parahaemolyticus]HCE2846192.1 hypothetical protein [Vibrio parahaemolyticus]HCE2862106.1 hypothetical protein [Vibrio parahaemolyticus]
MKVFSINKSNIITKFVPFLLVLGLALPISKGGFILSYLFSYILVIILFFVSEKIKLDKISISLVLFVGVTLAISAFYDSLSSNSYWFLRELIRFPLFLVVLLSFKFLKSEFIKNLTIWFCFLIVFDFVFLFLFKNSYFSKIIISNVAMSGMADYLEAYWRHIGIGGNPNFSSFLYAIFIILGLEFFRKNKRSISMTLCFFILSGLLLAFFLLILTFSRTSLVALFLAMIIIYLKVRYLPYIFAFIFSVFLYLYVDSEFLAKISARLTSFSSFEHRVDMWKELLIYYDLKAAIVGRSLPVHISVTDNDYLYFFFRFGFFVSILLLFTPWYLLFTKISGSVKRLVLGVLVFYYIAAFPGGTLTHPKTYVFLLFMVVLLSNCEDANVDKK